MSLSGSNWSAHNPSSRRGRRWRRRTCHTYHCQVHNGQRTIHHPGGGGGGVVCTRSIIQEEEKEEEEEEQEEQEKEEEEDLPHLSLSGSQWSAHNPLSHQYLPWLSHLLHGGPPVSCTGAPPAMLPLETTHNMCHTKPACHTKRRMGT